MTQEEYIAKNVDEAKFYAARGTDRGGNKIYSTAAYIDAAKRNATMNYSRVARLRGWDK